jgi:hypothetical protein
MTAPWTSSPETDQVIPAMVGALGAMDAVSKAHTADAGSYKYSYADLADVLDVVRPALRDNGLGVTQTANTLDGSSVSITTTLMHSSGQWITFAALVLPSGRDAQSVGSALTYARRYAVLAIFGIATEDDDGAAATRGAVAVQQTPKVNPADAARAKVTYDRLKMIAGTDTAAALRTLADESNRKLTVAAFVDDPAWRATVDERLDAATDQPDETEPEPPADPPSTVGSRGRADLEVLEQIRECGARLELDESDLIDVASAVLGRQIADLDRLTKTSAAKVLTELLAQVADFTDTEEPS